MRLICIVALMSALPAFAGAPDQDFAMRILGWSKAGHVALRIYGEDSSRGRSCRIEAVIVDLVSDKIVWQRVAAWADGEDEENLPDCPGPQGALKKVQPEIDAALKKFGITGPESVEVKQFPAGSVTVTLEPGKDGFDVMAKSETLGSKVIGRATSYTTEEEPSVVGWIAGPDKARIGVLVQSPCYPGTPCWLPTVMGCHLRKGFKK